MSFLVEHDWSDFRISAEDDRMGKMNFFPKVLI